MTTELERAWGTVKKTAMSIADVDVSYEVGKNHVVFAVSHPLRSNILSIRDVTSLSKVLVNAAIAVLNALSTLGADRSPPPDLTEVLVNLDKHALQINNFLVHIPTSNSARFGEYLPGDFRDALRDEGIYNVKG